jgi:hypothetical protein
MTSPLVAVGLPYNHRREVAFSVNTVVSSDVAKIIQIVCDHTGVTLAELRDRTRKRRIVEPRQICFHILRTLLPGRQATTLSGIGRIFNKDHASVLHGYRACINMLDTDASFRTTYAQIMKKCKESVISPGAEDANTREALIETIKEMTERVRRIESKMRHQGVEFTPFTLEEVEEGEGHVL